MVWWGVREVVCRVLRWSSWMSGGRSCERGSSEGSSRKVGLADVKMRGVRIAKNMARRPIGKKVGFMIASYSPYLASTNV